MTSALSGKGTRLIRAGYVVAELKSISDFGVEADEIDATNTDSLNGWKEFIPGQKSGTLAIDANFIPGDTNGQAAIIYDEAAGTARAYELAFPNSMGHSWEFSGVVTSVSVDTPMDGVTGFKAGFRITGEPTINTTGSTGLTTPFFVVTGSDSGALTPSPVASGSVYDYSVSAANADATVTITPTASAGVIKVNGATVATGVASGAITLTAGEYNKIFVTVTETDKAPVIYYIEVYRATA